MTAVTRTGGFPLAFRSLGPRWRESLEQVIQFARSNGFAGVDVGPLPAAQLKAVTAAGLRLGSVDLPQPWAELASPDRGKREAAVAQQAAYIREAAGAGAKIFFIVILADQPDRKRSEAFAHAVEGWSALSSAVADLKVKLAIEGWPGGAPHYHSLVCTPEAYRTFLKAMPNRVMAINYDPSHLIRMGIDSLRFVKEFGEHVAHVHGKDTELLSEHLYEYGNLQTPINGFTIPWGQTTWRYTIPGHGVAPWSRLLAALQDANYQGLVSIELEDMNFNGSDEGEQRGFLASRDFLIHA